MIRKELNDYWNPNLYDQSHSFVSEYGKSLINLLNPKEGETILDLGCGTGDLTVELAERGVSVIGIDQSENMILQAQKKYPKIKFDVQDATDLQFVDWFDGVFSNATLHWVNPPIKALESIYTSLKAGGRFVAEFGGKGNVQTITSEIIKEINNENIEFSNRHFPWYYPSIAEYSNLMESVGFRVTFAQHYDRPTPLAGENGLKNWISMFGSQLFEGVNEEQKETIISRVEMSLKPKLFDGEKWLADYKRIRVIGIKE